MSVYQDRIQGTDRLLRIRRTKRFVYLAIVVLAVLLVYLRMASEAASLKPLFLPLDGPLEIGLMMGLVGTLLGFYFRNLEIQAAVRESQRYLMTKYSMGRAVTTAALGLGIAILLLLPMASAGAGSVFTDAPRLIPLNPGETQKVMFTSPDPFGVSFVRYAQVTVNPGSGNVEVLLERSNRTIKNLTLTATQYVPFAVEPDGWSSQAGWSISFRNLATSGSIVSLVLEMGALPPLFSTVPFLLILLASVNLGWWFRLRPIRGQSKGAALYAGGAIDLDGGERAYAEYAANPVTDVVPTTIHITPPPPPPSIPPPPPVPGTSAALQPAPAVTKAEARQVPSRPDTADSFTMKGDALVMALQYAPAVIAYNEALRLDPQHRPALLAKAGALAALGKDSEALDVYRKILVLDPNHDAALRATAALLAKGARWRESLEAVESYLRRRPNDPSALELKGDILVNLGRRPEALASYEASTALDPSNANVKQKIEEVRVDVPGLLSRALIASASGNYGQALNQFDDILEVEPSNVNALIGKAVAYRRSGKPQEALNCLDLVLNIQPANEAAFLNRGSVLVEQGNLEAALATFDKLVALAPEDWEAWAARADVLVKLGRDEDALKAYAEALKRNPGDEDLQQRIDELEGSKILGGDAMQDLYRIKGIGPARAKALLEAGFKTPEDFRKASVEQLLAVHGITRRIAEDLVKHFKGPLVEAH